MSTPWLQITVELVEGRDLVLWPRPGRVFVASPTHAFGALAGGIDSAFARWDQSHLHEFRRQNGERVGRADPDWDSGDVLDEREQKLSRLEAGEELLYIFDFGDGWHHLVTVGTERLDPREQFGVAPRHPVVLFGWGDIPDQYGRRFADDDGSARIPADPRRADLPPLFPWWGAEARHYDT
jgi:hypothetical protein